jgi:hypothetical protein
VICQRSLGGSIDPYVFVDRGGARYVIWKNDGNCCGRQVMLWSQRLSNQERLLGQPRRLLTYDRPWERPLIENPAMVRSPARGGAYHLFYAANWWESRTYGTGLARCQGPLGPCRKLSTTRPWHGTTPFAYGPGGASFFTDTGGRNWMAEHGWSNPPGDVGYSNGARRSLYIEKVDFSAGRPSVNLAYPYRYEQDAPHPFVDVPTWVNGAVAWAWRKEIISGYDDAPDRTFRPNRDVERREAVIHVRRTRPGRRVDDLSQGGAPITRGQAARLLYQAAGEPNVRSSDYAHGFTDVPTSLRNPVRWIVHDPDGNGPQSPIAEGFPNDTYRPAQPLTRAAWVRMLHRWRTPA